MINSKPPGIVSQHGAAHASVDGVAADRSALSPVIATSSRRPPESRESRNEGRVLSLDGGGTKGFQTLGVLAELEAWVGVPLGDYFNVIYGTSTGACTAAFLGLGARVEEIVAFYRTHIPPVLHERTPAAKSAALAAFCRRAFGLRLFTDFGTRIGIVCTDWQREGPLVLKTSSTPPGFGCTIARAVQASCSAYPVFNSSRVRLAGRGVAELVDGSYCANNPVVFAISEAVSGLRLPPSQLKVLSVGVGNYAAPDYHGLKRLIKLLPSVGVLQKTFGINTESMEQLRLELFPHVPAVRINDHFGQDVPAIDFIESDPKKFDLLFQFGRRSFRRHAGALEVLLGQ